MALDIAMAAIYRLDLARLADVLTVICTSGNIYGTHVHTYIVSVYTCTMYIHFKERSLKIDALLIVLDNPVYEDHSAAHMCP